MMVLYLVTAFIIYMVYAALPYFKIENYILIGLICGTCGNLIWLRMASQLKDHNSIFFMGIIFDVLLTLAFIATPLALKKVHLNSHAYLALFLIVGNLVYLKVNLQ